MWKQELLEPALKEIEESWLEWQRFGMGRYPEGKHLGIYTWYSKNFMDMMIEIERRLSIDVKKAEAARLRGEV